MLRKIMNSQRLTRLLAIALGGTGTAALGFGASDATLVDNGTGDYTLTFTKPFGRVPVVVASPLTADVIVQISAKSKTAITVKAFDATDGTTAKDADLDLIIFGSDAEDAT